MSTTNASGPTASPRDRLEAELLDVFAFEPSADVIERLDDRIEGSLRAWHPRATRRSRLRPGRRAGLTGLLAAVFAIGGATGSLQGLYLLVAGPFDDPWHRGEALNLSQVVDGYRVTIDQAYADSARLALAISVVDELHRPGTTQLMAMSTVVTDAAGEYSGIGATSRPDGAFAAVNVVWAIPAALPLPAGPRQFHVILPFIGVRDDTTPPPNADATGWNPWHEYPGPWIFDFELTVDGGTTITPDVVAGVDGVQVKVSRLIVASNITRVELQIGGTLPADSWGAVGDVRHNGRVLQFVVGEVDSDGTIAVLTDGGVDDATGEWTVTVDELVGGDARLAGPWVLRFSYP